MGEFISFIIILCFLTMVLLILLRFLLLVPLLRFLQLQLLLLFASVQQQAFVGVRSSPVKQLTGLSAEGRRLRSSQFAIGSIQSAVWSSVMILNTNIYKSIAGSICSATNSL